jgi:hypothetical protein
LPYNDKKERIFIGDLKNKDTVLFRNGWGEPTALSHSGDWESRFDEKLAEIGLFSRKPSNNNDSSRYKRSH